MIDLSVVIVSWNSLPDLEGCLPALRAGMQQHSWEVILIDNASTDSTVSFVTECLPSARIIRNRKNAGFAAANNQGLAAAAGRYLCLLNPDTIVREQALDTLIVFMDDHRAAWACGPGILNRDGSAQRTGVRFPSLWNLFVETLFLDRLSPTSRVFGRHRELYEDAAAERPVDYVQGSCLVVRKEVLETVGLLDERFFMYFEETDWCYRIKKGGGEVWIVPSAGVVHLGGDATGHFDERRLVFYYQSLLRFFDKHHTLWKRIAVRILVVVRSLIRIISWGTVGLFRPKVRAAAWSSCRGYLRVALSLGTRNA